MIKIKNIDIVPALFEKYVDDKVSLKCYLNEDVIQNRLFDVKYIKHIKNPKYFLIGIKTGSGVIEITITDANSYEDLFKKNYFSI